MSGLSGRTAVSTVVLLTGWLPLGAQQPTPAGDQFQINTYTTGVQVDASVSVAADGDFVVCWVSAGSTGTDSTFSIQAQRYSSAGAALGAEFQVNTYTTGNQRDPQAVLAGDGTLIAVWDSVGSGGTDSSAVSVQGQRYASNGNALGGEFQVNSFTANDQTKPSVSSDADGGFVVVWQSRGSSGTDSDSWSVQGQRYASNGTPLGAEFQVNTYTTGEQDRPSVSVGPDGGFVVVWASSDSAGTDSSADSVHGQRYAPNGLPLGGDFQVNTYTTGGQYFPRVSMDSAGGFVVVWWSEGSGGTDISSASVQARRYASNGMALGSEFQVNTHTVGRQYFPAVSMDPSGGFVVAWTDEGPTGGDDSFSIQGRRYASDGAAQGGEFQVNTYTTNSQFTVSVAARSSDEFVAAWSSDGSPGGDASSFSVQGQRYGVFVFADGFESGDTSAWANVAP